MARIFISYGRSTAPQARRIADSLRDLSHDVWIDDQHVTLTNGQLVVVPAGRKHGFSNAGKAVLHIESTLAAPVFEAAYDDKRESPRRWLPGGGATR